MTLNLDFSVTWIMDAVDVLCAQLTRDLFAIAKYLVSFCPKNCRRKCDIPTVIRKQIAYVRPRRTRRANLSTSCRSLWTIICFRSYSLVADCTMLNCFRLIGNTDEDVDEPLCQISKQ